MDANTMLIDIMHDPRAFAINEKQYYRITRRNPVGIRDKIDMMVYEPFRLRDSRPLATWNGDDGVRRVWNNVGVINNTNGISIVIDLRDVFLADEL